MAEQLGIHHLTAEDLVNANQRTKLERFADHFHVALHDLVFDGEVLQNREVDVVFSDGWLLSVRHSNGAEMAPAGKEALARFELQRGEHGTNDEGFLLWAIFDVIVDRYFDVTDCDRRTARRDRGGGVRPHAPTCIPREIFTLRRSTSSRSAAPRHRCARSLNAAPPQGDRVRRRRGDRALPRRLRPHAARRSTSSSRSATSSPACSKANLAVMSNQLNQVMKKMSSWGAILIVATLIAGIYGMNFRHMPELTWEFGYPFALALDGDHDDRALPHLQA